MTGRGSGLADEGLRRKQKAICRGIDVNRPDPTDPIDVLAKVGGFDIAAILDQYEDLSFIRGVHLHQSLTGELAKSIRKSWKKIEGTYIEQQWDVLGNVFRLDTHRPFCSNRIREIFSRLPGLEFVCLEQITATREENAAYLKEQMKYLKV